MYKASPFIRSLVGFLASASMVVASFAPIAAPLAHAVNAGVVTGITVGAQSGTLTSGTAGSATFTVSFARTGNNAAISGLSVTSGLPAGASANWSATNSSGNGNNDPAPVTLTINTTVATPAGSFVFTVSSTDPSLSTTGTLVVGAAPVNNAPTANSLSVTTDENTATSSTLTGADADSNPITFGIETGPAHGTISLFTPSTGSFTYTPATDYFGSDSFTFTTNDGTASSSAATVSITVNEVVVPPGNTAPVANALSVTTDENTATSSTVTGTDTDPLTFATTTNPTNGTLVFSPTGAFTYTPNASYVGADSFAFEANDGTASSSPATVSITVQASSGSGCTYVNTTTFDGFASGSVNGQGGWSVTNPAFDQEVVSNTYGFPTFGCKTLRISDAVTSGSFGDQLFSPSTANEAGETAAATSTFSGGTRTSHFEAQFDLASTMATLQSGMHMSVSPDRGDGARMSYLRFEDQADGIHVFFDDVVNPGPISTPSNFVETDIATLSRTAPHTIKFTMDFVDGPANDVVAISIDGTTVHTGTSWEDYYRYDSEQTPTGNQVPAVDSLLFRESGTATPANDGNGFLIDNVFPVSGVPTTPSSQDEESGGGGGGGSRRNTTNNQGEVLGAETGPATFGQCSAMLNTYMRLGGTNTMVQVMLLQNFLNIELGTTLAVSGIFDEATDAAVRAFQAKYAQDILAPWGLTLPTGNVYALTQWKINSIVCPGVAPKPAVAPLGGGMGGMGDGTTAPGAQGNGIGAGVTLGDHNSAGSSTASSTASKSKNPAAAALGFGTTLPAWFWLLVLALIILGGSSWYAYNKSKTQA